MYEYLPLGLLLTLLTSQVSAGNFTLIYYEGYGFKKQCPPQDLCSVRVPELGWGHKGKTSFSLQEFKDSNCFCDHVCFLYGDCCVDAINTTVMYELNLAEHQPIFKCTKIMGHIDGVYSYGKCPLGYDQQDIRDSCVNETDYVSDPFSNIPVFSFYSNITYKNIFCAVCNEGLMAAYSKAFVPILRCKTAFPLPSVLTIVNDLLRRVLYNQRTGKWEPKVQGDPLVSHGCSMVLETPPSAADHIRYCKPSVSRCATNWTEAETVQRCGKHTAYVYEVSQENERRTTYKNPDCAVCNHKDVTGLSCTYSLPKEEENIIGLLEKTVNYLLVLPQLLHLDIPKIKLDLHPLKAILSKVPVIKNVQKILSVVRRSAPTQDVDKISTFSYALLLDTNFTRGGNIVGTDQKCAAGEIYNPFGNKCISILCGRYSSYNSVTHTCSNSV